MVIRQKACQYVTQNEGYRRYMYKDSEGIPTIGIGINLEDGLSREEADLLLHHRLAKLEGTLLSAVPVFRQVNIVRKIVLLDMAYNLGVPRLLQFKKMLAAIAEQDFDKAALELLDSKYATQVKGRAVRNAKMMRTGEWHDVDQCSDE